jgi:hypothetical protein
MLRLQYDEDDRSWNQVKADVFQMVIGNNIMNLDDAMLKYYSTMKTIAPGTRSKQTVANEQSWREWVSRNVTMYPDRDKGVVYLSVLSCIESCESHTSVYTIHPRLTSDKSLLTANVLCNCILCKLSAGLHASDWKKILILIHSAGITLRKWGLFLLRLSQESGFRYYFYWSLNGIRYCRSYDVSRTYCMKEVRWERYQVLYSLY